ncbi:hypothetical protein GBF38_008777 [Nibea albiflora]|uniref:Uncharacterized protein n=1 Tax=Nibea albiflora TaxID=240163 RepID=A0ACB7ERP5_NIBAL|nr:hypothetical protein GBF38_008777 [Nibea albiflora]
MAFSCAPHAVDAHSRADPREERHRLGGSRCCAPSEMSTSTHLHTCPQTCENKTKSVTARPRAEGADSEKSQNEPKYPVYKQCGHRALCSSARGMGVTIPGEQSDRPRCSGGGARGLFPRSTTRRRRSTPVGSSCHIAGAAIRFSSLSQTLNKNNLHVNDETCNHFSSPLPSSNMFTTTYYPTSLSKYDFHPDSPCRTYMHS